MSKYSLASIALVFLVLCLLTSKRVLRFLIFSLFMGASLNSYSYNRAKDYGNWKDFDKDCQNTRHEILIDRSEVPVSLKTRKNGKKCTVATGKWKDFYYPEILTSARRVDIDHVVPLFHAHNNGASSWNKKKRVTFANDPLNLVITNLKYNRSKGAKSPLQWVPVNKTYACRYLKRWIAVKKKYGLKIHPTIFKNEKLSCK